ncbi:MAG: hypothetical protein E7487_03985 [Ruminococcaceae bacterium]|nr:hypothetical protein [Oscillospiraceae bacterium]
MTAEQLYDMLGDIEENHIALAGTTNRKKKIGTAAWVRWGAVAACLCIVIVLVVILVPETTPDTVLPSNDTQEGPPHIIVEGHTFYISPHMAVSREIPEGFVFAGEAEMVGMGVCSYYRNPEIPEWVYVLHEVATDGAVDTTGTLNRTEPQDSYVRYVDERVRGKYMVSYNGELYIELWNAVYYGENPDVSREFYDSVKRAFGVRIEGAAPEGFVSVGMMEFSGYDRIPEGILSGNKGKLEVLVSPEDPDVILVETRWHTATANENGETEHRGYDVYVRCENPLS